MKEKLNKPVEEIIADRIIADTMAWGHDYAREDEKNMRALLPGDFGIQSRLNFIINKKPEIQMVHIFDAEKGQGIRIGLQSSNNVIFDLEARKVIKEKENSLSIVQNLEKGALLIEYGIGGKEFIEVLNQIEVKAREKGLFDESNNRKRPENLTLIVGKKMEVDKIFNKKGTLYPLLDKEPKEVRQMFDKPEELVLRQDSYTGRDLGFISKKDLNYFEKHDKIVNDVLIEMGIQVNDLLLLWQKDEKLAMLIAQEIKKEVDKRMEEN